MEKLHKKYDDLFRIHKALGVSIQRYEEALSDNTSDHETQEERRDSVFKRFELTFDLLWKYLREYIIATQGISFDTPRKLFQQCLTLGITNEDETRQLVALIESRNLTAHVYDIDLANEVAEKISHYFNVIHEIIVRLTPES